MKFPIFVTPLALLSVMPAFAGAGPCSVWPDRILRVNNEGASNLLFVLRTAQGSTLPGVDRIAEVGGLFFKRDPKGQCRGSTSAACRDVNRWSETPAISVGSPTGTREDSITLYLGSSKAPFHYEGVFYVQFEGGRREWLNNPTNDAGNFWFTQDSTNSLPQSASWDFDLLRVARTADFAHWSNPGRCR